MNAPKFTAGPWKLDAGDPRYIRSVKTREYIACRQSENPADGSLLRAAPDGYALAEAIEALESSPLQADNVPPKIRAMAKAFLAKARGETP